ncbi:E3 ubiquitin-protein ligase TRIM39-like [Pygocentrus nattereri]|uniref:E3 ubiquitin-protein ligase TRIM39-like n=1 Tax=Pygocentrus nattereri TaxID=42514 RepID=UPI0008145722|nr:E3 ubiquitin-protein ligase TRIM39-like [Pygocentrus nattereri]
MASVSDFLSEDQFLCSICLDVLTDPVSTPCGHNFCKTCLTEHWRISQHWHCPFCKEKCVDPKFEMNTTLREAVDHFKRSGLDNPEVLCDVCIGVGLTALKSCLMCLTSYCKTHLYPHEQVPALKKHKLINPVKNLEDYICQKHERPLEMLCRVDQKYVCDFCINTDHKTHSTVPIEEESRKTKTQLGPVQAKMQWMIHERLMKLQKIKHSLKLSKRNTEKEKADSVEVYTALIRSIERSQAELLEVMEEKQKAAEKQAEELIKELEQEITKLKRRDTELEQLSHTEDHLHLLQIYPSLCTPPHTNNWTDINFEPYQSVETVRKTLSELQKSLNEKLYEAVFREMKRSNEYAVNVMLDPETAHPNLILSDDGKQVRHTCRQQNRPDDSQRFDTCCNVLGKEGFFSDRFYYEVQVRDKTDWVLGVSRESIKRKGVITLSPENGFWTVSLRKGNKYDANDITLVPLYLREKLQKVGVFVDYEQGLVSFYNVESRSHIYSFTGQSFTEKLYPFFSPGNNDGGKNSAPLIISLVSKN